MSIKSFFPVQSIKKAVNPALPAAEPKQEEIIPKNKNEVKKKGKAGKSSETPKDYESKTLEHPNEEASIILETPKEKKGAKKLGEYEKKEMIKSENKEPAKGRKKQEKEKAAIEEQKKKLNEKEKDTPIEEEIIEKANKNKKRLKRAKEFEENNLDFEEHVQRKKELLEKEKEERKVAELVHLPELGRFKYADDEEKEAKGKSSNPMGLKSFLEKKNEQKAQDKVNKQEPVPKQEKEVFPDLRKRVLVQDIDFLDIDYGAPASEEEISDEEEGGEDLFAAFDKINLNIKNRMKIEKAAEVPANNISSSKLEKKEGNPKPSPSLSDYSQVEESKVIEMQIEQELKPVPKDLSDFNCFLLGEFTTYTRAQLKDVILKFEGKVTSFVTAKVTHFVKGIKMADNSEITKHDAYLRAEKLKLPIYTQEEFEKKFFERLGRKIRNNIIYVPTDIFIEVNNYVVENKPSFSQENFDVIEEKIEPSQSTELEKRVIKPRIIQPDHNKKPSPIKSNVQHSLWTHKYSPGNAKSLIGNSNLINSLREWLNCWENAVFRNIKRPVNFNSRDLNNPNARACLVSGPPGIGKTTAVRVMAKELGYELLEQNASDVRNKNSVNDFMNHLCENKLISSESLETTQRKFLILMDEVDGMSSDRGGSAALIQIIKKTKVPIICICNDRRSPKLKSLANHCYSLNFNKPSSSQIAVKMVEICKNEGFTTEQKTIELLCESSGCDIRQILNTLQMWSKTKKNIQYADAKSSLDSSKKDETVMINPFEAATKLLNRFEIGKLSHHAKLDLFFLDKDLLPLLIQENYLGVLAARFASLQKAMKVSTAIDHKEEIRELEKMAYTANLISGADIVDKRIKNANDWSLLPNYGFQSTVYPSQLCANSLAFPTFPGFFGKLSSTRKCARQLKELRCATGEIFTSNNFTFLSDTGPALLQLILEALKQKGKKSAEDALQIKDEYRITMELFKENLVDIQFNSKKSDPLAGIGAPTKSSLTKLYNQRNKGISAGKNAPKKGDKMDVEEEKNEDEDEKEIWEEAEEDRV